MTGASNGGGGRASAPLLLLIGVLFLTSRLLLLLNPQPASDVAHYARYALEQRTAAHRGASFYDVHAEAVQQRADQVKGDQAAALEEYKDVEYPPLALAFMRLPTLWMGGGAADEESAPEFDEKGPFAEAYRSAYRLGMAVVDAGLFALVVVLMHRLFPQESGREWMGRLLAYLAGTTALWYLLYDRLDLLQAALVMVSLALLLSRLHYAWSFAVLALAVNFKLVPVVLAPVWVVASWPARERLDFFRPRVWAALVARVGILLGLTAGFFLPFYLADGSRCLGFLAYHRARGVEFESLYGSLLMALHALGQPLEVRYSYGSVNLISPLSPALAASSLWLTAGLLLGAIALLLVAGKSKIDHPLVHGRRLAVRDDGDGRATLAQRDPHPFVCYTLLFLMLFVAGNKVFSPQYLLWLAPLVSLIPLPSRGRRPFLWVFVLTCVLTTIIFPFLLTTDLVDWDAVPPPGSPYFFKEPTARLALAVATRNLFFLWLAAGLVVHLIRRARGSPPEPREKATTAEISSPSPG